MRRSALSWILLPILVGCTTGTAVEPETPLAAVEQTESYEKTFGVHPQVRERNLKKRFPGVEHLRFLKVVVSAHERSGPCWTAAAPLKDTGLELAYVLEGEEERRSLSGTADLARHRGRPVYRTPEGRGFELSGPFRSVDLEVGTSFTCRCSVRDGEVEGDHRSLKLRLRWSNGGMPEVSAAVLDDARREALRPRLTSGGLFGYEFETGASFPEGVRGRCGIRVDLALLVDPPIE